jgi:hypothetical protein
MSAYAGDVRQVFISYRRADSLGTAGRIRDKLATVFGDEHVYFDIATIPPGVDFRVHLDMMVSECEYVLVLIGPRWLDIADDGGRRLDQPGDWVRTEIESALRRGIPVVPVLVEGAPMPRPEQLPESIRDLAFRNAVQVRNDPDFHPDMDRLMIGLLGIAPQPAPSVEGPTEHGAVPPMPMAPGDGAQLTPQELFHRAFERRAAGDEGGAIDDFHAAMFLDPQAVHEVFGNGHAPTIGPGDAGPWVLYLQFLLTSGGMEVENDGVFGPATEAAVMGAQEYLRIVPDGVVGSITWMAMAFGWPGIAPVLRMGDVGAWVVLLQQKLAEGGLVLAVDGVFGPQTRDAVRTMQRATGLDPNAVVGSMTWTALGLPG